MLVLGFLLVGCALGSGFGIHRVFRIDDPLPRDLSAYETLGVRMISASADPSDEAVTKLRELFVAKMKAKAVFEDVVVITEASSLRPDLEMLVRVSVLSEVSRWDRFVGSTEIAGVLAHVSVTEALSGKELGSGTVGGQSDPHDPKGITVDAIEVAAEQLVRFMTGEGQGFSSRNRD